MRRTVKMIVVQKRHHGKMYMSCYWIRNDFIRPWKFESMNLELTWIFYRICNISRKKKGKEIYRNGSKLSTERNIAAWRTGPQPLGWPVCAGDCGDVLPGVRFSPRETYRRWCATEGDNKSHRQAGPIGRVRPPPLARTEGRPGRGSRRWWRAPNAMPVIPACSGGWTESTGGERDRRDARHRAWRQPWRKVATVKEDFRPWLISCGIWVRDRSEVVLWIHRCKKFE